MVIPAPGFFCSSHPTHPAHQHTFPSADSTSKHKLEASTYAATVTPAVCRGTTTLAANRSFIFSLTLSTNQFQYNSPRDASKLDHITPLLKPPQWLPIIFRIQISFLGVEGPGPPSQNSPPTTISSLLFGHMGFLLLSPKYTKSVCSKGHESASPSAWNTSPTDLKWDLLLTDLLQPCTAWGSQE